MNDKTEQPNPDRITEFSPGTIRALIIATCATLLLVFLPYSNRDRSPSPQTFAPPQIVAAGVTVAQSINDFQGMPAERIRLRMRLSLLVSLLVGFVIAPVCVFWTWRFLQLKKLEPGKSDEKKNKHLAAKALMIVAGILLMYFCVSNVSSAILSPMVYNTLKLDNLMDRHRNAILQDLADIDYRAKQYLALPRELGGGYHSFKSTRDSRAERWVTLEELGLSAETKNGTYSIVTVKDDTLLVLKGVGKIPLADGTLPTYEFRSSQILSIPAKVN
ncbi:MAG: hypothetical protein NTV54_11835 [Ignavibacteriales bacterium]|nr:hypothetical protein [Ignavibacteriales bacterium]